MKLITSNLLRHGYCLHVFHHFSTSPLINLYSYLTEFNKKTSDNRTNPNVNCIFLSTAELTNMGFQICTDTIYCANEEKTTTTTTISVFLTKTWTHYTTPKKSKVFSLGTKKAISWILNEWNLSRNTLLHTDTHMK